MTSTAEGKWLKAGITAVKSGDKKKGRTFLLKAIEADERNEQAWLWLSGAVETDEEQQICLENVLAVNPDNQAAQKGLRRLGLSGPSMPPAPRPPAKNDTEEYVVRREYQPNSLAGAILYPESLEKEWRWQEPALSHQPAAVEIKTESAFDDVWTRAVEICPFCAQELEFDDTTCPRCSRNLISKHFRYEKPSANLHIFWVCLLGLGNLYLIQAIYDVIAARNLGLAVGHLFLTAVFMLLTAAVYKRQFWAFVTSMLMLSGILLVRLLVNLVQVDLSAYPLLQADEVISKTANSLVQMLGGTIWALQLGATLLGLIFALFLVMPDFVRDTRRQVAELKKGLHHAGDYHGAAKKFAQKEMWATAVLHWQRAAANAPNQLLYHRSLAMAYARLGFFDRSLNVLNSAHDMLSNDESRTKIKKMIQAVQQQQNVSPDSQAKS